MLVHRAVEEILENIGIPPLLTQSQSKVNSVVTSVVLWYKGNNRFLSEFYLFCLWNGCGL